MSEWFHGRRGWIGRDAEATGELFALIVLAPFRFIKWLFVDRRRRAAERRREARIMQAAEDLPPFDMWPQENQERLTRTLDASRRLGEEGRESLKRDIRDWGQ